MGFFQKLREGLTKTRQSMASKLGAVFSIFTPGNDDFYDELEETLITADVGVQAAMDISDKLRTAEKEKRLRTPEEMNAELKNILLEILKDGGSPLKLDTKPSVILVIGVNGVGKTTTIGKIACDLTKKGKKVLLAAGDTFRAAAVEQLGIWAERAKADFVGTEEGTDPSAVVYDACSAAKARGCDVLIIDTAGRLHNKANLMAELSKMNRVIERELPGASRETLLVLDSTTGQNAVNQAEEFNKTADITGIVLTKLDGTAKGGIVIAIADSLGIPVKYIGVGEGADDLGEFVPEEFVDGLFE